MGQEVREERTICRFLEEWRTQGRSLHTVKLYGKVLRVFAAWLLSGKAGLQSNEVGQDVEDLDVTAFTPTTLERYRQYLQDRRGLRPKTINTYLGVLRVFAAWLGVEGLDDFCWNQPVRFARVTPLTELLWTEMARREWTVEDLSAHTGLPVRHLMLFLRGRRVPDVAGCVALARVLDYELVAFLRAGGLL